MVDKDLGFLQKEMTHFAIVSLKSFERYEHQ
mgnify:CR=1 FL=1